MPTDRAPEKVYPNRYEAVGAAIEEARRLARIAVVLHGADCHRVRLRTDCRCGPVVIEVGHDGR